MRDQDDRVWIGREVFLQPVAGFEIEMVRWLVEQQQARASEQQLRERDAHLPAARKGLARAIEVRGHEAEPAQHGRDPQVDAVALEPPELLLQIAVARQHLGVLVVVGVLVSEPIFDRGDLRAHVEERLEGQSGFLDERASRVAEAVLRQIADGEPCGLRDEAAVGLFEPRHHLQQRGLPGPVWAGKADAIAVVDLPADGVQEDAAAERF